MARGKSRTWKAMTQHFINGHPVVKFGIVRPLQSGQTAFQWLFIFQ